MDATENASPEGPERDGGAWRWLALLVGLLVVASAGAVLRAGFSFYRASTGALDDAASLLSGEQPTAVVRNSALILTELADAAELATAIYTLDTIVDERQDRTLGALTIGQTRLLYVASGQVRAGVDLGQLDEADVSIDNGDVQVRLPPPRILDEKIDVDRSYVYDIDKSLLGPPDAGMQSRAERYALDKIVLAACQGGILEAANTRAEEAVRLLLEAAGFDDVTVVTSEPGACRSAATDTPGTTEPSEPSG